MGFLKNESRTMFQKTNRKAGLFQVGYLHLQISYRATFALKIQFLILPKQDFIQLLENQT